MGVPGNANALLLRSAAAAGGYQVSRSLRFNSSDSAFLSRTPASAGNRKTWTWAAWVKRSAISSGSYMDLFTALTGANDFTEIRYHFNANDDALMLSHVVGGVGYYVYSSNVFRDPSSWYHIVVAVDTTQATSANRVKIYVNGVQVTQNTSGGYPAQNSDTSINATAEHRHGSINTYGRYFSGYLADIHFIDGQALTPSSFTEVSATTGQLIPKAYTGSFGTNGFWLQFADNSNNTATTLGKDTSGNSNNWTPNNLSVTAGAGNDSLVDTPTSYGTGNSGGDVRGNFCTWNPLDKAGNATFSNGNLDAQTGASGYGTTRGTVGVSSGKWYWEVTFNSTDASNDLLVGILDTSASLAEYLGGNAKGYAYWAYNGQKVNTGAGNVNYGSSYAPGDIIGVALDLDAGNLVFYKNGTSQGTAYSSLSGTFSPAFSDSGGSNISLTANFGQRPFAYTAPSGFKALCDTNLPAPVVAKPNTVMDVKLYTGNGSTQTISGLGFSPDFVWIKRRDATANHDVTDTVRGATKSLYTSLTQGEATDAGALTAFNSDGFSLGATGTVNTNNGTYAAWTWDAGTSTVTNTQGSITSSVRANPSAGFSVVSFSYPSSGAFTVGHGLNAAPSLIIAKHKNRSSDWAVYHVALGKDYWLSINTTGAATSASNFWGTSAVSSSTFGGSVGTSGISTDQDIAYCFAPVAGYSSFGSYTGNGSADGPFVYTGFRPRWIMVKNTSLGTINDYWVLFDAARNGYNVTEQILIPNLSDAEGTSTNNGIDLLSNGFKWRATHTSRNASGSTYIYAAFAESPFQFSRAR